MLAPVYRTIRTPAVQAIVEDRVYGSGLAPQGVVKPYVTWFTVVDLPYLDLSAPPRADSGTVQIDCWAGPGREHESTCVRLARAVRDALDAAGIANHLVVHLHEPETDLFRIGLQADFIRNR